MAGLIMGDGCICIEESELTLLQSTRMNRHAPIQYSYLCININSELYYINIILY